MPGAEAPKEGKWWDKLPDVKFGGEFPEPPDDERSLLDDLIDMVTGADSKR